ncbi:ubiquitin-like domain-containing protein CIP73 isoform X2 [Zingiber officinale]|uniref:ubiquitin-like domain-containing protein CIP73 isoform X2 n=1 Tax=Zingiber officinale TaxID=94328 RepID=UPI001C4BD8D9|nr:ubiquitin-like domain-containing protein CIP73 isoform X2 [Zingiber officinale]
MRLLGVLGLSLISIWSFEENMGAYDPSEATTSCIDSTKDSQSTVEIKIKTLDSRTYTLRVDKSVPIPKLKEQIAGITGVISEQQRLICRGKVLKDDEILSTYHVEDGHTLHLVVRQPQPFSSFPSTSHMENEGAPVSNATSDTHRSHVGQGARTLVFETVNIGQGDHHTQHLSQIISSILNAVATRNTGSQTSSTDLRDLGARTSLDVPGGELGSRQLPDQFQPAVSLGPQQPTVIPDSLTTIHQYLSFMRDEFFREGVEYRNEANITNMLGNGLQSRHSFIPGGLPSPASLVEVLLSTRELLMMQVDGYISQFAGRLEDQASLTNTLMRGNLQNSVLRSGVLLQNLGSLLLELGRTTMTLRLGERPADAVINAGPAVFISATGPNPVMVQPVPFYPGSNFNAHMGAAHNGHGLQGESLGTTFLPGNISIRLRAGTQGGQQVQGSTNPTENTSTANVAHQAVSGAPNNPAVAGDSGVRVLPIRTVVSVPAGAGRSTSESSGSAVGLIYPFLARVQHVTSGNLDDAGANELSNGVNDNGHNSEQQHTTGSTIESQNLESSIGGFIHEINQISSSTVSLASGLNASINESASASHQGSLRDFLSGGQQLQSGINNNEIQFDQQNRQSPISQLTGRLDQWLQSFFPTEQVHVDATDHPEVARGSSTDQAGIGGNSPPEVGVGVSEDGLFFSRPPCRTRMTLVLPKFVETHLRLPILNVQGENDFDIHMEVSKFCIKRQQILQSKLLSTPHLILNVFLRSLLKMNVIQLLRDPKNFSPTSELRRIQDDICNSFC